jgi:hypothetical protein
MSAGSDLLVDETVDFTALPLTEMNNLHVHWGTPEAGVNDMKFDNDDGHPIRTSTTSLKSLMRTRCGCICRPEPPIP